METLRPSLNDRCAASCRDFSLSSMTEMSVLPAPVVHRCSGVTDQDTIMWCQLEPSCVVHMKVRS